MADVSDDVARAACLGNRDALSHVYESLAPKVLGYLRAHGVEDPDGLTNEVFLQVIPRLSRLTGGSAGLRTFVFSVAHARVVDEVRRRARRPRESPYEVDDDQRTGPSAETEALAHADAPQVVSLLARLSEEQRNVVALRILGDLGVEETARILDRSTGSVKQLQRRALLTMRTLMEREEVAL